MAKENILAGRYRLEEKIGTGGLAIVYRAWDNTLDRPVAVKVLRPEKARDPEVVSRFRREAHAAAKLNHPHIVQIYDTGQDEAQGLYYLVMEYLPEPDLKRVINDFAPLPGEKVIEVAIQCCQALAYAHRQGLVHRDVKPHNILFTDQGVAKLSDFGIAAAVGEVGTIAPGIVLGSAAYISPEQAQGKPAGPQSDLYSLGCVMFEGLTGRPPFVGENAAQVAARHVHERIPSARALNPLITPAEEYILRKALARDLNRRYAAAEEMLSDLTKLATGKELNRTGILSRSEERTLPLQVTAPTPGRAEEVPRGRDSSLIYGTVVAIAVALVALLAAYWLIKVAFYPHTTPMMVQVPALKGHSQSDAQVELAEAELKLGKVDYRWDPEAPEGTILDQSPGGGETVHAGMAIDIVINRGLEVVSVPDLLGLNLTDAAERIGETGFILGKVDQLFSEVVPEGQVMDQSIPAGTSVKKGTALDVAVSKGPEMKVEEPPEEEEGPPEEAEETWAVAAPQIECTVDESYKGADPRERRYLLTITVMGEQKAQRIRVIKRDEAGGSEVVLDEKIDPGTSTEQIILARGNTAIQVYHEGQPAEEFIFPMPTDRDSSGGEPETD